VGGLGELVAYLVRPCWLVNGTAWCLANVQHDPRTCIAPSTEGLLCARLNRGEHPLSTLFGCAVRALGFNFSGSSAAEGVVGWLILGHFSSEILIGKFRWNLLKPFETICRCVCMKAQQREGRLDLGGGEGAYGTHCCFVKCPRLPTHLSECRWPRCNFSRGMSMPVCPSLSRPTMTCK
jgi:hypothetical protein